MARITLEDLDRLGDEEEEEDEEGGEDEEDEEERGRLFAHWEAVASTHRVNLPRGERRGEPGRGAARTGGGGTPPFPGPPPPRCALPCRHGGPHRPDEPAQPGAGGRALRRPVAARQGEAPPGTALSAPLLRCR